VPPALIYGSTVLLARRGFSVHLRRRFIRPEALKAGVAQATVPGPFGESHFSDQLGSHPVHPGLPDGIEKRRSLHLTGHQLLMQLAKKFIRKASTDLSRVTEPVSVVVVSDENCPEPNA
jgi:hypothetical protein